MSPYRVSSPVRRAYERPEVIFLLDADDTYSLASWRWIWCRPGAWEATRSLAREARDLDHRRFRRSLPRAALAWLLGRP